MFVHKITYRLLVFVLITCSSVNGMNAPFTIRFEGDARENIEPSIIPMFPHLQKAYDQGIREQQSTFSPQSVKLALEIARLKTKVNKLVPTNIAITQYKSALKQSGTRKYTDDERREAANFAQVMGNAELAELINSLAKTMNMPKQATVTYREPIAPFIVNPEQKFVLKEGENIFTITKGYFPYIDKLVEFHAEKKRVPLKNLKSCPA